MQYYSIIQCIETGDSIFREADYAIESMKYYYRIFDYNHYKEFRFTDEKERAFMAYNLAPITIGSIYDIRIV